MASQLNVAYAYSWHLPSSDLANVQRIMESVRAFCIELGCEEVSSLCVKPDSVKFTAVVPDAGHHEFGLIVSPEDSTWETSGWLKVSSFKQVSRVMFHVATMVPEVRTMFAGIEMIYRRNSLGVIEVEQRSAFDPDTF